MIWSEDYMASNETKVKSFRVSQEVTEHIQRLMEERQLTTNQLFEEFIQLANKQAPAPLIDEENSVLESTLNQIVALFNERATRLERQQSEARRINSKHMETIRELEQSVVAESDELKMEYDKKVALFHEERAELENQITQLSEEKTLLQSTLDSEQKAFKEELKVHKKLIFDLEGKVKQLEDERTQLNRQNQSLMDVVDDLKGRTRRSDQLEEENQKLHLEVQLLRREKEAFENRMKEQIELAVLRERNHQPDNS